MENLVPSAFSNSICATLFRFFQVVIASKRIFAKGEIMAVSAIIVIGSIVT